MAWKKPDSIFSPRKRQHSEGCNLILCRGTEVSLSEFLNPGQCRLRLIVLTIHNIWRVVAVRVDVGKGQEKPGVGSREESA